MLDDSAAFIISETSTESDAYERSVPALSRWVDSICSAANLSLNMKSGKRSLSLAARRFAAREEIVLRYRPFAYIFVPLLARAEARPG